MADIASAPVAVPKKKASKPKVPAAHPKYSEMVAKALSELKERGGSSRQAILKYIMDNFKVNDDDKKVNTHLKLALRAGVKNGSLMQPKGSGASGSFKLNAEAKKKAEKKPKKKAATPKKPAAKKPKKAATPKKAGEKKAKSDGEKKAPKKKSPKKATAGEKKAKKPAGEKKAKKPAGEKKAKKPAAAKKPKTPKKATQAKPKKAATKKAAPKK